MDNDLFEMDSVGSVGFVTPRSSRSRESTVEKSPSINLTLVGDSGVGKSSLLYSYLYNKFPYKSAILSDLRRRRPLRTSVALNGVTYYINLWDSNGESDLEEDYPEAYKKADCFLVCYSLSNRVTFDDLMSKWLPKLKLSFPNTPNIIAGLKSDKVRYGERLFEKQLSSLSSQSSATIPKIYRCSAKHGQGIEYVFMKGILSAVKNLQQSQLSSEFCSCF